MSGDRAVRGEERAQQTQRPEVQSDYPFGEAERAYVARTIARDGSVCGNPKLKNGALQPSLQARDTTPHDTLAEAC
ncbi:MAG TPA: hypothetical protein VHC20_07095 [Candidatus Paceibacterota bacterium]|nr:hypothetical protein [Candidatus Paceibacterota bacterium]